MRYIIGVAIEKEINAYARQNVYVRSVDRTLGPKMGKSVRLREREEERNAALFRGKIFFGDPLEATGLLVEMGQGITRKGRSTGVKVSIISGHCISRRYPTERKIGNGMEVGMPRQYLSLSSMIFLLRRCHRASCAKARNHYAEDEFSNQH